MWEWLGRTIDEAADSFMSWALVIGGTFAVGFCAGYWIGHGEITGSQRTLSALSLVPMLWMGNPEMFATYGVTVVAWYLPLHYDSRRFRVACAAANLLVWFVVIYAVVVKTANGKFFRY